MIDGGNRMAESEWLMAEGMNVGKPSGLRQKLSAFLFPAIGCRSWLLVISLSAGPQRRKRLE